MDLRVSVQGRYYSYNAAMTLPELQQKCFEPTKTCDREFLQLNVGEVSKEAGKLIMQTREDAAEVIAKELALMIVKAMRENDTHNGFKVEE